MERWDGHMWRYYRLYFTLYYIDDDLRSYVVDSTLLLILLNVPVELGVAPLLVSMSTYYIAYNV